MEVVADVYFTGRTPQAAFHTVVYRLPGRDLEGSYPDIHYPGELLYLPGQEPVPADVSLIGSVGYLQVIDLVIVAQVLDGNGRYMAYISGELGGQSIAVSVYVQLSPVAKGVGYRTGGADNNLIAAFGPCKRLMLGLEM